MKTTKHTMLMAAAMMLLPLSASAQGKTLYGYSRDYPYGLLNIDAANPAAAARVATSDMLPTAGAIKDETMYLFAMDDDFNTIFYSADLTTGALTKLKNLGEAAPLPVEATYSYSDETMYFVTSSENVDGVSSIWTVDLTTGKMTRLNDNVGIYVRALGSTAEGDLYAVSNTGDFCSISKTTWKATKIGSTGRSVYLFQSMDFDRSTGILYFANYDSNGNNTLCTIDLVTGAATPVGTIGSGKGIFTVGLDVPYKAADEAAPAKVDELTAEADAAGLLSATVSWTNPTTTVNGQTLAQLSKVEVLRGDQLVATITDAQPGKASSFVDNTMTANGEYRYHVLAYNEAGASADKFVDVWVGHDLLSAPLAAMADLWGANKIANVVNWHAPASGMHGGYVDLDGVKYNIYRLKDDETDGTLIAGNLALTANSVGTFEYVDEDLPAPVRYTYQIEPVNADGVGESALTNIVVNGPAIALPFEADFNSKADAMLWTPINYNQDYSEFEWHWYSALGRNLYLYQAHETNYPLDYLASPALVFTEGHEYKVTVEACNSFAPYPEKFNVWSMQSNSATGAGLGAPLSEQDITLNHADELRPYEFFIPAIPDDGLGTDHDQFASFIAVSCNSDYGMSMLLVGSVKVEDLTALAVRGVETTSNDDADVWYNLQGVRIDAPTTKGVYIRNGHKQIVR